MQTFKKWVVPACLGGLYAAVLILLSQAILRNLDISVLRASSAIAGVDRDMLAHICQAFGQLRDASIASPWLLFLPAGILGGFLLGLLPQKLNWIRIALAVLALIPGILLSVCLSEVNGIRVIDLVRNVLPLLSAL